MQAGDLLRVHNNAGGTDFIYSVCEIQMGDIGRESIVILQSISRGRNQSDNAREIHQVPLPLIDNNPNYEVYTLAT